MTIAAPIDPAQFRRAVAGFPSGVTVVTVLDEAGGLAGFTASSFTWLSSDPALVLVCPSLTSATYPHIKRAGRFAVHLLASGQQDVAMAFASKGAEKVAGLDWTLSPLGNPLLPGVGCILECALRQEHPGGDHAILVGEVQRIEPMEGDVLLYHRGRMTDHVTPAREVQPA